MHHFIGSTRLPNKNTNWFIRTVEDTPTVRLISIALLGYALIAISFSSIFHLIAWLGKPLIFSNDSPVQGFAEVVYFNFITILTVGYGDLHPVGVGRFLAALEALIGVGLFGSVIGVVIIKLTNPDKRSIVFSKYGYYALDVNRFFIIFVNTTGTPFVNVELSSILKISRNNHVEPPSTAPYIGESVWVFYLHRLLPDKMRQLTYFQDDGLKFGLSGNYGFARFATAVKYTFEDILVVSDSNALANNPLTLEPKFGSEDFEKIFHFKPQGAILFSEYAEKLKNESAINNA